MAIQDAERDCAKVLFEYLFAMVMRCTCPEGCRPQRHPAP